MDQEWRCISYSRGIPMPLLVYTWCKGSGCRKFCHWDLKRNLNIHMGWYVLLIHLSISVPSYSFCGYAFPISCATTTVLYQIPNLWCVLKNVGTFPAASSRFVRISYCFPGLELMGAKEDPRLAPHLALMCSSFCCFGLVWVDISFQCPVQRGDGHGIESPFGMITYLESHFNPSEPLRGTQFWICSYL